VLEDRKWNQVGGRVVVRILVAGGAVRDVLIFAVLHDDVALRDLMMNKLSRRHHSYTTAPRRRNNVKTKTKNKTLELKTGAYLGGLAPGRPFSRP